MKSLEDINILVVGDIMLDKYVIGEVKKISAEAPVPIVNVTKEYYQLGGCGNVVKNIRELGCKVDCISSVAKDKYGQIVLEEIRKLNVGNYITISSEKTTVKERIMADERHVQMLRIDREVIKPIQSSIKDNTNLNMKNYDIVIVSDYAKGMITKPLMNFLKENHNKIIVDPKPSNINLYSNIYMITPNEFEWRQITEQNKHMTILQNVSFVLITEGKYGMSLFDNQNSWKIIPETVEVFNPSGAGDTVVAMMSVCIAMGWNELDSANIANKCAAYVVTQTDTASIPKDKFLKIIQNYKQGDI